MKEDRNITWGNLKGMKSFNRSGIEGRSTILIYKQSKTKYGQQNKINKLIFLRKLMK